MQKKRQAANIIFVVNKGGNETVTLTKCSWCIYLSECVNVGTNLIHHMIFCGISHKFHIKPSVSGKLFISQWYILIKIMKLVDSIDKRQTFTCGYLDISSNVVNADCFEKNKSVAPHDDVWGCSQLIFLWCC